jgi:hypothetical protein
MAINPSRIQANFAVTVLRIAKDSDIDVAIRLLQGLMIDLPTSDVTNEQARLHSGAIDAYKALVVVLREGKPGVTPQWAAAQDATERWRFAT